MSHTKSIINIFIIVLLSTFGIISPSYADTHKKCLTMALALDYSDEIFSAAQKAGKHIVIDIWKEGCPTCKAQHPTLEKAKKIYPNAVFLKVDFSNDKDTVRKFQVVKQSTIIVFRGEEETGRVLGETKENKLLELIATGK